MKKSTHKILMLGIALGLVFIVLRLFLAPQSPSPRTVVSVPVSQALPEPVVPEVPEPVVEAPPPPGPVVEPSKPSHKSRIALVLDDVGMEAEGAKRAMKLPPFVTLSFMTYAPHLQERADEAKALGHELLLHMPMQPNGNADPGPNALRTDMSYDDVNRLVEEDLGSFKGYDGVNNHMGSKFTADKGRMNVVVAALKKHGVFFLDSRTGVKSVAYDVARKAGLPAVARDVFIDDTATTEAVKKELAHAERIAEQSGTAIVIGHPHAVTLQELETWIPEAEKRGFVFVPLHDVVPHWE